MIIFILVLIALKENLFLNKFAKFFIDATKNAFQGEEELRAQGTLQTFKSYKQRIDPICGGIQRLSRRFHITEEVLWV